MGGYKWVPSMKKRKERGTGRQGRDRSIEKALYSPLPPLCCVCIGLHYMRAGKKAGRLR